VGGDLVDYLPLGPDRTGLVIADVSGKGLSAALLMAKLQTIVRTLAAEYPALRQFASRVNDAFRREGLANIFASMVYIELTPGTGHIRYINAGHPPPLLVHAGGITSTDKGDAAIGLIPQTAFRERSADLAPGDLFICYSDGVTEARNAQGEFFGVERLTAKLQGSRSLSAPETGAMLIAAVDRFVGEVRPHDDLSLVILKRG
jgi:sigma-B regulation protein RsbU (phosphoserine phosphatase)